MQPGENVYYLLWSSMRIFCIVYSVTIFSIFMQQANLRTYRILKGVIFFSAQNLCFDLGFFAMNSVTQKWTLSFNLDSHKEHEAFCYKLWQYFENNIYDLYKLSCRQSFHRRFVKKAEPLLCICNVKMRKLIFQQYSFWDIDKSCSGLNIEHQTRTMIKNTKYSYKYSVANLLF